MDIHSRLYELLKQQGWTKYRLAKECGLSEATIANIFTRHNTPTIATLEIICKGMGISLSQFFATDPMIELSPELKQFCDEWVFLTKEQKDAVLHVMKEMNSKAK